MSRYYTVVYFEADSQTDAEMAHSVLIELMTRNRHLFLKQGADIDWDIDVEECNDEEED